MQQQKYKFFYNPMWDHFGDHDEAGGTFYYEGAEPLCYYWNLFDQVLLRPDLLEGFAPENVRIPTSIGDFSLLQEDGQPDKEIAVGPSAGDAGADVLRGSRWLTPTIFGRPILPTPT